ncbi:MAG: flagellin [Thaumarchaeota archaeon]|jgi:hypothetical protein|nr:flagellin [Candidatus Geocrenenecus arthurdayi]MCL7403393.1 flagellin [Candidatus Geocrenenecus arthurdayi]
MPVGSLMTEVILAIVSMVVASTIATVYISNMSQAADLQKLQLAKIKEETEYNCRIVFAYSSRSSNTIRLWVKNNGAKQISPQLVKHSEILLISSNNVKYLLYGDYTPSWTYNLPNDIDGDNKWDPSETLEVTIKLDETIIEGDYTIKLILFNGRTCEYTFSV